LTDPGLISPVLNSPALIDAHQHVWDLAAHDQPWLAMPGNEPIRRTYAEADLRPLALAAGVTGTVVVQTVTELTETTELLALAARSDLVAGVVGWADLRDAGVAGALAALAERPDGHLLRGLRHPLLTEPDPDWLLRADVQRGLTAAGDAGLCFDLVLTPDVLPAAVTAARACPGTTFVLDHLGNPEVKARPEPSWSGPVAELGLLPNTACKLSGVLSEPLAPVRPFYEIALEAFGPERLMFGSDWPVCTLRASYATVVAAARDLTAELSPDERAEIFAGTARRSYGLARALPY
jgi:L-fuconolactonase